MRCYHHQWSLGLPLNPLECDNFYNNYLDGENLSPDLRQTFVASAANPPDKAQQLLCDMAYTTGLPSTGIFALHMPCSAMRTSQIALQSTGGKWCVRALVSFYVAPVVTTQ